MFRNRRLISALLVFVLSFTAIVYADRGDETKSPKIDSIEYDAGPPDTPMGRELLDILAEIPYVPGMSLELTGAQKIRLAFGPTFYNMPGLKPDSIEVLAIGQDAVHNAEGAGRTAYAAFGAYVNHIVSTYLNARLGFMNAFAYTIKGQYGAHNVPYIYYNEQGEPTLRQSAFVDNGLWLLANDPRSPMVIWRNRLIDWIIRNNKNSLKAVLLFGGAAKDAFAVYLQSLGAEVATRTSETKMGSIQIPWTKLVYSGGNNEYPTIVTPDGKDLAAELLGRKPDYKKAEDQKAAFEVIKENLSELLRTNRMILTRGGPYENGLMEPAQMGGYDLEDVKVNGEQTISMRNLRLSDGTPIKHDILFTAFPHPTALSKTNRTDPKRAAETVSRAFDPFQPYVKRGWTISKTSPFEMGKDYKKLGKKEFGPERNDFGSPRSRQVAKSDASRMAKNPHVILHGSRDRAQFPKGVIEAATNAQPAEAIDPDQMYISSSRTPETRYIFDSGPGDFYNELFRRSLDLETIFTPKKGKSWKTHGINAFNVKTHPYAADFGHYRGKLDKPRVLILADPDGMDDYFTSRALTGTRGQFLHGLMRDLKVGDGYLIIKTVPFGMDGATSSEWEKVLSQTQKYRDELFSALLSSHTPELILADGRHAQEEIERILTSRNVSIPVVNIARRGLGNNFGIVNAGNEIKKLKLFNVVEVMGERANIPHSHLPPLHKVWHGVFGDRGFNSLDAKNAGQKKVPFTRGKVVGYVAPKGAWAQRVPFDLATQSGVDALKQELHQNGFPEPGQKPEQFLASKEAGLIPTPPIKLTARREEEKPNVKCDDALDGLSKVN